MHTHFIDKLRKILFRMVGNLDRNIFAHFTEQTRFINKILIKILLRMGSNLV